MYSIRDNKVSEQNEPKARRHLVDWIAIGVLAVAIAGLSWYSYPTLSQAPGQLSGLQKSFEGLKARLAQTEDRINNWISNQQELQGHVAKLDQDMASGFQKVRKQEQGLKAEVGRVRTEMVAQTQGIETKVTQLESASESGRAGVDKLQTELTTLREETALQAEQIRNVQTEVERERAGRAGQLVSLTELLDRKTHDVEDLTRKLAVTRVDFEVTRNHNQEIAGGVSLNITGTDLSHRRITGWMWVMPDRRTIWLRAQGAQQPVVFYGCQDGKRRELVITNVTKDSATGYLLLPGDGPNNVAASLANDDPAAE
jgi:hypothetical protein